MRITTKKESQDAPAGRSWGAIWRVYANGKKTDLVIVFDRTVREWDLSTETDFVMAAHSKGAILRRLDTLLKALEAGR